MRILSIGYALRDCGKTIPTSMAQLGQYNVTVLAPATGIAARYVVPLNKDEHTMFITKFHSVHSQQPKKLTNSTISSPSAKRAIIELRARSECAVALSGLLFFWGNTAPCALWWSFR